MKFSIIAEKGNLQADIQGKGGDIIDGIMAVMERDERVARLITLAVAQHNDTECQDSIRISPSEALYGFMAWLTTRKEKVTFSDSDDASKAAELVNMFCKAQEFDDPRDCYPENINRMNEKGQGACRNCGEFHE